MGEASSTHLCTAAQYAALLLPTSCLTAIAPAQHGFCRGGARHGQELPCGCYFSRSRRAAANRIGWQPRPTPPTDGRPAKTMGKPNRKRRFRAIAQAILQALAFKHLKPTQPSPRGRGHITGPSEWCPQIPV